jgi:hypothetical protein
MEPQKTTEPPKEVATIPSNSQRTSVEPLPETPPVGTALTFEDEPFQ